MARTSSAGLPHLTCRSDAGQYTYHRAFAPDVVPFLEGTLRLSWTKRPVELKCRRVIKVSFGTGDRKLAGTRWEEMHHLVQAAVRDAERRIDATRKAEISRIVPERIAPEAIAAMAAQVLHRTLADHDRTYCEPGHMNATAQVFEKVLAKAGTGEPAPADMRDAERFFRRGRYRDALQERELGRLDMSIVEGEIAVSDELSERLLNDPSSLTQAERLEIFNAPFVAPRVVPGEIDTLLSVNGFRLPPGHPSRAPLALAVARAQVRAAEIERAREAGRPEIETPSMPPLVGPVAVPAPKTSPEPDDSRRLSSLFERWKRDKRPSAKQANDKERYVKLFISRFGDLPAEQVTPLMVCEFRDGLLHVPRNTPEAMRHASLDALLAWRLKPENAGSKTLSRPTINAKGLGALSVVLRIAKQLGFVQSNPCSDQALELKQGDKKKRVAYNLNDLKRAFACGVFATPPRITAGARGPAAFWLPLLALFTGARLEELGQLLIRDVRRSNEIDYLIVTNLSDDEDEDDANQSGGSDEKNVKTAASRRRIPIHSELKKIGFMEFVARGRSAGLSRLFPELPYYRGSCTKNWSRYWARLSDNHITNRHDKAFHSFRHGFIRKLRSIELPDSLIKVLVGHSLDSDVTSGYGGDDEGFIFELPVLASAVESVRYTDLDLTHLVGRSAACGW